MGQGWIHQVSDTLHEQHTDNAKNVYHKKSNSTANPNKVPLVIVVVPTNGCLSEIELILVCVSQEWINQWWSTNFIVPPSHGTQNFEEDAQQTLTHSIAVAVLFCCHFLHHKWTNQWWYIGIFIEQPIQAESLQEVTTNPSIAVAASVVVWRSWVPLWYTNIIVAPLHVMHA